MAIRFPQPQPQPDTDTAGASNAQPPPPLFLMVTTDRMYGTSTGTGYELMPVGRRLYMQACMAQQQCADLERRRLARRTARAHRKRQPDGHPQMFRPLQEFPRPPYRQCNETRSGTGRDWPCTRIAPALRGLLLSTYVGMLRPATFGADRWTWYAALRLGRLLAALYLRGGVFGVNDMRFVQRCTMLDVPVPVLSVSGPLAKDGKLVVSAKQNTEKCNYCGNAICESREIMTIV